MNTKQDKKLSFANIAIEVTRKCNMHCAHCMRGDAQNADISEGKLSKFLSQVNFIGSLTITGGEPTLNVNAIKAILTYCKLFNIPVMDFYVVTNGKEITTEFLNSLIDWYVYCIECGGEPELCGIALSQDVFHESIPHENFAKLRALSFFRPDDKNTRQWKQPPLINLGRARQLQEYTKRNVCRIEEIDVSTQDDTIFVNDTPIAFTVNGDILYDCDYEYEEENDIKICSFENAAETFYKIATDPNFTL